MENQCNYDKILIKYLSVTVWELNSEVLKLLNKTKLKSFSETQKTTCEKRLLSLQPPQSITLGVGISFISSPEIISGNMPSNITYRNKQINCIPTNYD